MRDRAALALACGLTFAAAMPAGQTSAAPFAVGVLRRDGIVVPFAQHDGKRWRAIWREPNEQVDVPIDVRNVPSRWWGKPGPLDTWQAWPRAEPARTVRVRQPDWFPAHCRRQIGLRTDYRSIQPPAEPGTQPFPKDGLAVAPPQPVEGIDIVQPGEPPPQVIDAFNEAEDAAIRDLRGHAARLPASRRHRQGGVAQIEAIYGVGDPNGTRIYYFEVSRQYQDNRPAQCPDVTFGAGWFVREGAAPLRKLRFDVEVVDCERYGLLYMLPLGAMRLSNKLFWISQWSGWDYEEYTVTEIKAKAVEDAVRVWGGGC